MASSIDMNLLPPNVPSLCIPRVFQNITKERVVFVFRSLGLGEIDHIDMIPRTSENGDKFQRVFIHFKRWSSSDEAVRARERVLGGKEIKVIYDDPWFWKISANRSTPRDPGSSRPPVSRPSASLPRIVDDFASSDNDEGLRVAKSSHRRPYKGGNRGPRNDNSTPPKDDGGAWTTVDYGKVEMPKPKKRIIKKPLLKEEQEPGEV